MGCACGDKSSKFTYVYTSATGTQQVYNTQIEAEAAKIRAGGGGSVRAVPKP